MARTLTRVTATPAGKSHETITAHYDDGATEVLRQRATLLRDYQWAAQHSHHAAASSEAAITLHQRRELARSWGWTAKHGTPDTVTVIQIERAPRG